MTKPNVYVDSEKEPGQSLYEHAAAGYVGKKPNAWPLWSTLSPEDKASWAEDEKDMYPRSDR